MESNTAPVPIPHSEDRHLLVAASAPTNLFVPVRSLPRSRATTDVSMTTASAPLAPLAYIPPHLDIVNFPLQELLLMLSLLLQKIIDANDALHADRYHDVAQRHRDNRYTANVMAFHGKNVPAIPIYNYFLRILKYCPMTNEVFLSLLVYFDRIAKRANGANDAGSLDGLRAGPTQLFVMDSYNIHRLIIGGITVASKFFSDVFYKNARYARVGGLPLEELNNIELQFLLLTDFRLLIQPDELQRYGDLLLKFWRRERELAGG